MARKFISTLESPVVQTTAGKLRGYILDGIYTFHGIKYADADRFQAPRPVEHWDGIKNATSYGYICPVSANPAPTGELFIPHRFWPANEHCQYLNIWTPGIGEEKKRPVMVWFHGGGYSDGSNIEQVAYEGDKLAEYGDVVVVTVGHRLNILGFLDMSSFGEKYANSVNAGMADIVASLKWIHENIAAFGGDPNNVLIFGQSGGGGKVKTLLNIPEAAGLFHKAIMMSGGCRPAAGTNADHREIIERILEILHISIENVEELEKVPYELLNRAYLQVVSEKNIAKGTMRWEPIANDWYLGDPFTVGFSDYAKTVPTMVGTVFAEFTAQGNPEEYALSEDKQLQIIRSTFGDEADSLIKEFKAIYPDKAIINLARMDTSTRPGAVKFAEIKSEASTAPTYLYHFTLNFDIMDGVPAWHCSDIPLVFHNSERVPNCNIEGVTERLEDQMAGAWVSFAYAGNPNHPGMPKWDAFNSDTKPTMVFDRESSCRNDYDTALREHIISVVPPVSIDEILKRNNTNNGTQKEEKTWMY